MAARLRRERRTSAAVSLAILLAGMLLAFGAMRWLVDDMNAESTERLDRLAGRVRTTIEQRFRTPVYGLRGLASEFVAHGTPTRDQFAAFVGARDLPGEFPGVRGFGYAERVRRGAVAGFLARARADGSPDFTIRTSGDAPDMYVVRFIEPAASNAAALGLDIFAERARRTAIDTAVATATAALTEAVTLAQTGAGRPGFLLVYPVYSAPTAPADTAARRLTATGVVYEIGRAHV